MDSILKILAKELSEIRGIASIIIYGSFARGEHTPRSDIDLLILIESSTARRHVEEKIMQIEPKIGRSVQPTVRTYAELQKTDSGLLRNIFYEGKVLYLKAPLDIPAAMLLQQKPYLIYSFVLTGIKQKIKAKFNRNIYERAESGRGYPGILKKLGGEKLSSGCILVPFSGRREIEKLFKRFKIRFKVIKIWK